MSSAMDYIVRLGVALDHISKIQMVKPDIELRIRNGQVLIFKDGQEAEVARVGIRMVPMTDCDWEMLAEQLALA